VTNIHLAPCKRFHYIGAFAKYTSSGNSVTNIHLAPCTTLDHVGAFIKHKQWKRGLKRARIRIYWHNVCETALHQMLRLQRRKTLKRTALQDDVHKTALGQQMWG
jgi:hypothetical protein